jgi:hypothetical protein
LPVAICRYVIPATCSSKSSRCRGGSASTAAWIELQADAEGAGIASSPSTVQDRRARPSHSASTSAAMRMTWRCGSSSRAESFAAHSRRETSCARTSTCTAAAIGRKSSPLRPSFRVASSSSLNTRFATRASQRIRRAVPCRARSARIPSVDTQWPSGCAALAPPRRSPGRRNSVA